MRNAFLLPFIASGLVALALTGCSGSSSNDGATGSDSDKGPNANSGDSHGSSRTQGGPMCLTEHWCWENPSPQGYSLHAVHGTASNDVWAVGDHGTVLWYGGEAWTLTPSGTQTDLRGVWAANRDDAWIVGDKGTLLHWDGSKLAPSTVTDKNIVSVTGSASNDVWAVTMDADGDDHVAILHWNGTTWSKAPTELLRSSSIHARSADDVWVSGQSDTALPFLLHYDGSEWTSMRAPVDWTTDEVGFASDGTTTWSFTWPNNWGSRIYERTEDSWEIRHGDELELNGYHAIWAHDGIVWGTGEEKVLRMEGDSLEQIDNPIRGEAIWGTGEDDIWQVGPLGAMAHWDGASWTANDAVPNNGFLFALALMSGTGPNDVWTLPQWGNDALHYDGTRWSASKVLDGSWHFIWGTSDSVWLAREDHYSDGSADVGRWDGTKWSPLPALPIDAPSITGLWASAANDVWLAHGNSGPHRWNGSTWSKVDVYARCRVQGSGPIWGASPTDVWLGSSLGLLHLTGADQPSPAGDTVERDCNIESGVTNINVLWGSAANDIWAGGRNGLLRHYDGTSWTTVTLPTTFNLTTIWGSGPDDVWVVALGGQPRDVLHWDGHTWTLVPELDDVTTVWGADATNIWMSVSPAGILRFAP